MNDKLSVSEFAKLLPDLFKDGKQISFNPQGKSMLPTIKEGDTVIFERCSRVRRYDIVFYIRADGKAILHRVIGFKKDGSLVTRGDSQSVKEYGITDKDIVAKVSAVLKNGKKYKTEGIWFYIKSFVILHLKYIKRLLT